MTGRRRERFLAFLAGVVLAVLVIDYAMVTPYRNRRERMQAERMEILSDIQRGRALLSRWREFSADWEGRWPFEDGGLDEGGMASLNALRDWAEESGLLLTLLRPEGTTGHEQWEETVFQVVAAGSMNGVAGFLWRVENAGLPLKIKNLQLSARREGSDDLALQVRVGALAPAPDPENGDWDQFGR